MAMAQMRPVSSSMELEDIEDLDEGILLCSPGAGSVFDSPICRSSPAGDQYLHIPLHNQPSSPDPSTSASPFIRLESPSTRAVSSSLFLDDPRRLDLDSPRTSVARSSSSTLEPECSMEAAAIQNLGGDRSPVGEGGWGPMMPGYALQPDVEFPTMISDKEVLGEDGSVRLDDGLRQTIPIMPRFLAIICFVLNILGPGLGTLLAGLSVLCCSHPRPPYTSRSNVIWSNVCISILQLLTTGFLLLGWIWSIAWGTSFIVLSRHDAKMSQWRNRTMVGHSNEAVQSSAPNHPHPHPHPPGFPGSSPHPSPSSLRPQRTISTTHQTASHSAILSPSSSGTTNRDCPDRTSTGRLPRCREWFGAVNTYPGMLLVPGALERIVRTGAYFMRGDTSGQTVCQAPNCGALAKKRSLARIVTHQ